MQQPTSSEDNKEAVAAGGQPEQSTPQGTHDAPPQPQQSPARGLDPMVPEDIGSNGQLLPAAAHAPPPPIPRVHLDAESDRLDAESVEAPLHIVSPESRVITDIATWGELFKYITAYEPTRRQRAGWDLMDPVVDIQAQCKICTGLLNLPSWVSKPPLETQEEAAAGARENVCLLPCGHFFGHSCISAWISSRWDGFQAPNCPSCRSELVYKECRHNIPLKIITEYQNFDAWCFPFTRLYRPGDVDWQQIVPEESPDHPTPTGVVSYPVNDRCLGCHWLCGECQIGIGAEETDIN